jgi:two-component system cell cycle sensor histidine kinase/response regulator CckA
MKGKSMTNRCSILVVDDDPESLALLIDLLASEGYQVRPADSGKLALASVAARPPHLILLDIRMPDIDGFEVCRRLKASKFTRSIPVMIISAAREVEERVAGLAVGAVDFVTKPFRREELLARVRMHLELAELRVQLEQRVVQRTAELSLAVELLEREVAERRQVEQALRESEARFRNMADAAPVMVWASGPDKLCTFCNKGWLVFTGRTMEQELGNGWAEGVHPDDFDRCFGTYSSSFDARQSFEVEYRLRRADGEYRLVLDRGVPRVAPDGSFAGYIGSCLDITDTRRAQEEAFDKQKLESLRVLTAGIAHDFNNLLGGILAEAELAETELTEGSSPYKEIQTIKAVAIRASEIVRQLMIYSGQDKRVAESVDVSRLVEEMRELLKVSVSKQVTLQIDLGKDLPAVMANSGEIWQLVMNLIINASDAIGDQAGVIDVGTSRVNLPDGDYLRLEISDTGRGMTEETRARIFDPFFTTKFPGHGLGLAVVQGIVRSYGGAINVVSAPGKGTRFEVLMPCAGAVNGNAPPSPRPALAEELAPASITVLVVEDDATLRLSVSTGLRKRGFSVLTADDGSAAVDVFDAYANDIDVVLLDLTLPGMSGLEVLKEIQKIRSGVSVILTSAYDREAAGSALFDEHGAAAFLRKPYRFNELVLVLQEAASVAW